MFGNQLLEIKKSNFSGEVVVKKTLGLGTYIQVNGITQSGKIIESIWKPVLKKLTKENAKIKSVLILGLGGGTVAKLIRKKFPYSKIVGVDIDPVMVSLGEKYLGLKNLNIDIKIADARKFKYKKYDLVIVDTYLGDKQVDVLTKKLTKSKIAVFNKLGKVGNFEKKLKSAFSTVEVIKPLVNTVFICKK